MPFKHIYADCCYKSWCHHHPRETGGDPLVEARKRTHSPLEAHVPESARQRDIRAELIQAGWAVWRVGQRNAKGTQDAGVPDLIAIHPRQGLVFVECKRPHRGVVSAKQQEFREACAEAGVAYVVASQVADLAEWCYPNAKEAV